MLRPRMRAIHSITNLLYPPACLLCHAALTTASGKDPKETVACPDCHRSMARSGPPVCVRCGVTLPGAFDARLLCRACRAHPPVFEQARAPWQYQGRIREAIHQFKYRRRWRLGRWLADDMATTAGTSLPLDDISLILPVPLHWLKRRLKGWNPAEDLAQAVAAALDKPCAPSALRRIRWTATQTRLRGRARFRNVRQAFCARPSLVSRQRVLLIDDVLTSSATAQACASALRQAGADRVFVLTAARTPVA